MKFSNRRNRYEHLPSPAKELTSVNFEINMRRFERRILKLKIKQLRQAKHALLVEDIEMEIQNQIAVGEIEVEGVQEIVLDKLLSQEKCVLNYEARWDVAIEAFEIESGEFIVSDSDDDVSDQDSDGGDVNTNQHDDE